MNLQELRALAAKTKKPAFKSWLELVSEIEMVPFKNALMVAADFEWERRVADLSTPNPNTGLLAASALPLSLVFQEDTWL